MSKYTKAVAAGNTDKSLKTSLSNHTNFAHIDDPSKTMPIDPDCIERVTVYDSTASGRLLTKSTSYNSKVVALAEQLKYQHENGNATQSLPDEFYLQYAQRLLSIQYCSKYGNVIPGIDVAPDPKYAQYSYEEIIAMANNGVNIPKEVLAWAKGQQEADVVDYIVVSDNDESSNDETNGESELNKVRSEVKAYAIKSKKAQEDINNDKLKADDLTNKAIMIANEQKRVFAQNSIDKTEEMVKEWKELDKKKKNEGKLSAAETAKYKKLSKQLDKNGEIIKNLETNSEMLDGFLESIDALNEETNEGITTAQKAINAASNLSQIDQPINPLTKIHAYKIADKSSGMLEDVLSNVDDVQLAMVTEKIGQDLENIGNETIYDISSDNTQEVVTFASDFVNKSKNIRNILSIASEDETQEEYNKENTFKGTNAFAKSMNDMFDEADNSMSNPFGFLFGFMAQPQVALLAAAATIFSTTYTLTEAAVLTTERLILGKNIKKAEEEDKKLEDEADKATSSFDLNNEKIAENTEKISEINEKNKEESGQEEGSSLVEDSEIFEQLPAQAKTELVEEEKEETIDPEVEELMSENESMEGENKTLQKKVQKPLNKSAKLLSQNKKSISKVDSISQVLDADIKELLKLSNNTMGTGVNNATAGVTNTIIASALMAQGMSMLSHFNPYGAYLCSVATEWFVIAQTQLAASPVAIAAAVTGIAGAATSKIEYEVANTLAGESRVKTKESNKLITKTSKEMGRLQVENTPDNEEGQVAVNDKEEANPIDTTNQNTDDEAKLSTETADQNIKTTETEDAENKNIKEDFQGSNTVAKGMNDMFNEMSGDEPNVPFGFLFSFLAQPQVALIATAATLLSSGYTLTEAGVLSTERILLTKDLKKEEEADKKLRQEAEEIAQKYESNNEKIDDNNEKLEDIKQEEAENMEELSKDPSKIDSEDESSNSDSESDEESLNAENESLTTENKLLQEKIKNPIAQSAKLLAKNKNTMSKMDNNAQVLDADIKELLKLSGNTALTGAMNINAGTTNTFIATGLMSKGVAMMASINPATVAFGSFLCKVALEWFAISALQLSAGATAVAGSVAGVTSGAASKIEYEVADALGKESKVKTKETQKLIIETAKSMGDLQLPEGVDETDPEQANTTADLTTSESSNEEDATSTSELSNVEPNTRVITNHRRSRSNNSVTKIEDNNTTPADDQISNIPQQEVQEHVAKNVAMGMQPQVAYNSFVQPYTSASAANTKSTERTSEAKKSDNVNANKNDENKQQEKEKVQDSQEGLKSDYGNNTDFVKLVVANNIVNFIGLGPHAYIFQLLKWAAIVGLSVLDLYARKGVVDQSADQAESDTSNVDSDVKQLISKSNEIKSQHDKNVKESKSLAIDFKTLNADTINYQFAMMQNQAKLVQLGRMNQEDVITDIEDPNAGAKTAIRANVAGIADKDAKLLSTINTPTSKAQTTMKVGRQSVQGFEGLNEKLTERNENNNTVGDTIITEAAISAGLITTIVATLLACGPWCWGLVGAWAVALAETAGMAATGAAAKVVSDKVGENIESNTQQSQNQEKRLMRDDKQMLDVRKTIAKASLDRMDYLPAEAAQTPSTSSMAETPAKKEDSEGENKDNSLELSKENEMKVGFSKTSLNAEIDPNKPADLKNANENVVAFVRNVNAVQEQSRAAASSTADASVKSDTTDKSDVKLARFNKSGAIDSKKRAQKVNAAASTNNRRKRR